MIFETQLDRVVWTPKKKGEPYEFLKKESLYKMCKCLVKCIEVPTFMLNTM